MLELLRYFRIVFLSGRLAEWSNAHRWKRCVPKGTAGSNPVSSELFFNINYYIYVEISLIRIFLVNISMILIFYVIIILWSILIYTH